MLPPAYARGSQGPKAEETETFGRVTVKTHT